MERAKLIKGIQERETLKKRKVTPETTEQFKRAYESMKIIDAHRIAHDVLYSKQ